ncbi:protein translocase subunit SecF [Massilioclostridium coli]|uniref:protein translocase subunit SecF n=1 Tax=Massilioclostridium coli TaxID=1870991 RepID=UPI00085C1A55|nr:protein translocase subunit SecF [Massilioclostridium coli]
MKTPNIDFVGKRKIFFSISIAIIAITIICAFILGVNVDIKFKGGTILTYPCSGEIDTKAVESTIEEQLGTNVSIQTSTDSTGNPNMVVTLSESKDLSIETTNALSEKLEETYPDNFQFEDAATEVTVSSVNPQTGTEFFFKCLVAIIFAFIVLVIYTAFRFRKIGGISAGCMAIIALAHDVMFIFATFVFFRLPINDNFMAVVLTILGYSINNTVVIYDRIRENRQIMGEHVPTRELVNKSINQTLSRSINTTLTTVLALLVILIVSLAFGIDTLISFVLPLVIAMIAGAYSSVCISGPLWVLWKDRPKKEVDPEKEQRKLEAQKEKEREQRAKEKAKRQAEAKKIADKKKAERLKEKEQEQKEANE